MANAFNFEPGEKYWSDGMVASSIRTSLFINSNMMFFWNDGLVEGYMVMRNNLDTGKFFLIMEEA